MCSRGHVWLWHLSRLAVAKSEDCLLAAGFIYTPTPSITVEVRGKHLKRERCSWASGIWISPRAGALRVGLTNAVIFWHLLWVLAVAQDSFHCPVSGVVSICLLPSADFCGPSRDLLQQVPVLLAPELDTVLQGRWQKINNFDFGLFIWVFFPFLSRKQLSPPLLCNTSFLLNIRWTQRMDTGTTTNVRSSISEAFLAPGQILLGWKKLFNKAFSVTNSVLYPWEVRKYPNLKSVVQLHNKMLLCVTSRSF